MATNAMATTTSKAFLRSVAPQPPLADAPGDSARPMLSPEAPRGGLHFISRGELRLADFKQLLGRERGLTAEIAGGSLVVNKAVVVRKVAGESRLVVEGAYGDDYLRVRDLLYAQYTVV